MRKQWFSVLGLVAILSMIAAGCANPEENLSADGGSEPPVADAPGSDGGGLTGEIVVSGSSTVEPVSARVAEKWNAANPNVAISVDGPGTGDGFEIFCNGESDISDASRAIKAEEAEKCAANGIEFVELKVAIDGLSVITSTQNDEVTCLSFTDLYALLGPESTGFESWADANELAGELAGTVDEEQWGPANGPYPDVPLVVSAPGEESGTYDSFVELALEKIADERGQSAEARPDYQASPNDNVIIEAISGTPTSLGWVGYAFVLANEGAVKALAVDKGQGCVEPTPATIADGTFPLSRPLFIYVSLQKAESKPELAHYVDFYLSDEGIASVAEVGYVDLTPEELASTRATWDARETGSGES